MSYPPSWTARRVETLRQLWAEGHSALTIARHMGVSKNSVLGKVHRMGLPLRPSPIKRDGDVPAKKHAIKRAGATTLTALPSIVDSDGPAIPDIVMPDTRFGVGGREIPLHGRGQRGAVVGATLVAVRAAPRLPGNMIGSSRTCCWPMTTGKPWRFCDAPSRPGTSWCPEHHSVVFERRGPAGADRTPRTP